MPGGIVLRTVALITLALGGIVSLTPTASAAEDDPRAVKELIETYSPIMMVRKQENPPCDTTEEQYQPTSVETVLGNQEVTLQRLRPDGKLESVMKGAKASDLAGLDEKHYLNYKGDPLGDTCEYAKDFAGMVDKGRAPKVIYANIAREDGRSGIAVQYWFFWYFNQFNDLHEGDWEGMQITFDADTPEEALEAGPDQMILFQHAGGERAMWDDAKVEKRGTHPVVYPGAGSHATFYYSAVFVENGGHGSGVGCDNTADPLREITPTPVVLPEDPKPGSGYEWLTYDGHWGQKLGGFNYGPTGPQTKDQRNAPFSWMEQQRWSSPRMPAGGLVGPNATEAFCGVIAGVTGWMNMEQADPVLAILFALVVIAAVSALFGWTRWRPVQTERLRARREYGQIMVATTRIYWRHWRTIAPLGAIGIPIIGGVQLLANMFADENTHSPLLLFLSDNLSGLGRPVASAVVAATAIVFLGALATGTTLSARNSIRGMRSRFWRVVIAQMAATLGVILMAATIVGIPWAIRYLVSWNFVQQEVLYTDKSIRESFRSSSRTVRGRWWHALRTIAPLQLVALIAGPVLGVVLIFTPVPLILVNLIGSLVYALLIPFVAIAQTLLYFDLRERAEEEPAKARRSWRIWRPSRFGRRLPAAT